MRIKKAEQLIQSYMAAHGLTQDYWTYSITSKPLHGGYLDGTPTMAAATCNVYYKKLKFSKDYLRSYSKHNVEQTVIHEVAHALSPGGAGHSKVWENKARELGYVSDLSPEELNDDIVWEQRQSDIKRRKQSNFILVGALSLLSVATFFMPVSPRKR
jgi:hypothetical protein